jgi:hypothetical protein
MVQDFKVRNAFGFSDALLDIPPDRTPLPISAVVAPKEPPEAYLVSLFEEIDLVCEIVHEFRVRLIHFLGDSPAQRFPRLTATSSHDSPGSSPRLTLRIHRPHLRIRTGIQCTRLSSLFSFLAQNLTPS